MLASLAFVPAACALNAACDADADAFDALVAAADLLASALSALACASSAYPRISALTPSSEKASFHTVVSVGAMPTVAVACTCQYKLPSYRTTSLSSYDAVAEYSRL